MPEILQVASDHVKRNSEYYLKSHGTQWAMVKHGLLVPLGIQLIVKQ
ncbi:MAG: hypothetical protein WBB69_17145 [Anaerolineales bacterium]